jgi:hypothetical protein
MRNSVNRGSFIIRRTINNMIPEIGNFLFGPLQ